MRIRTDPQILMMHTFLIPKTVLPLLPEPVAKPMESFAGHVMFWSDMSSSSEDGYETSDEEQSSHDHLGPVVEVHQLPQVPPHKR